MPSDSSRPGAIRCAGAVALVYVCLVALLLGTPGCYITGDHWTPPTYLDHGKRPSPPKYVQVLHWEKSDYFFARLWSGGRWYDEHFVLLNREFHGEHQGKGWYVPSWTSLAQSEHPQETATERSRKEFMSRCFPPGTVLRIDYPLAEDTSDFGKGGSVRVPVDGTWAPGAYGDMVIILGIGGPPDDLPEAYWKPPGKKAR